MTCLQSTAVVDRRTRVGGTSCRRFSPGSITTDLTEPPAPIAFISAENVTGLTAVAEVYDKVEALQAIWSDSTGRLPWEPSYRNAADAQPLLGPVPESFT